MQHRVDRPFLARSAGTLRCAQTIVSSPRRTVDPRSRRSRQATCCERERTLRTPRAANGPTTVSFTSPNLASWLAQSCSEQRRVSTFAPSTRRLSPAQLNSRTAPPFPGYCAPRLPHGLKTRAPVQTAHARRRGVRIARSLSGKATNAANSTYHSATNGIPSLCRTLSGYTSPPRATYMKRARTSSPRRGRCSSSSRETQRASNESSSG